VHESDLDSAAREIIGVIDQGEPIDLFGFRAGKVGDIGRDVGPFGRRVIPLAELDDVLVFAVIITVQM